MRLYFYLFIVFVFVPVNGAAASSPPDVSTLTASEGEGETEGMEEHAVGDGEPNTAELRRRRLRKLESGSSSSPPVDN